MPWDGTELRIADTAADGTFGPARTLIGGPEESVAQVEWAADGTLLAATDRTGWWNLHRVDPVSGEAVNLCPREEEFSRRAVEARPALVPPAARRPGRRPARCRRPRLGLLDPATGEVTDAGGRWTEWNPTLAVTGSRVIGVAASARTSYEIVELDAATGRTRVLGNAHHDTVDPAYLPDALDRVFTGPGGREVHAHIYPPRNPDSQARPARPPMRCGRTAAPPAAPRWSSTWRSPTSPPAVSASPRSTTAAPPATAARTATGCASSGASSTSRTARRSPKDSSPRAPRTPRGWPSGAAARAAGPAPPRSPRPAPTPAAPSSTRSSTCPAGPRPHGETHDFESHYLESLIGPLAEVPERYRDRSPVSHGDRITVPFLLLQGLDDPICPPVQCERFLTAVAGRGIPHAYLTFAGESHGFRRLDTMVTALESELALYGRVFGFHPAGIPELELTW